MDIAIVKTPEDAARMIARIIARTVKAKPSAVLGLATGSTMETVYAELVRLCEKNLLDFSGLTTFNLDEYVGLPPESPHSYRAFMNRQLFDHVNIDKALTFLPDGMAGDLKAECVRYEQRITDVGGIDLQLLGVGRNGHIGFNEPLSSLRSRTRDKILTPNTIKRNRKLFGEDADQMPKHALTMGVGTILDARHLVAVITGEEKSEAAAKAIEGPVTAMVTASALQLHPKCHIVLDEPAASKLREREYIEWIYNNDPDWDGLR